MVTIRTSLFLVLVLVNLQRVVSKPFLEELLCDWLCSDDEGDSGDDDSMCDGCGSSESDQPASLQPVNLMIPPMNGMNLTLASQGGNWFFNMIPWLSSAPSTTAAPAAAPAAAATTPAAGNGTAAATTPKAA